MNGDPQYYFRQTHVWYFLYSGIFAKTGKMATECLVCEDYLESFNKQKITALPVQAPTDLTSRSKIFKQFKAIFECCCKLG